MSLNSGSVTESKEHLVILFSVFSLITLIAVFVSEIYIFFILPVLLILIISSVVSYKYVFYLLVMSLPIAFSFRFGEMNLNISFPSEPLIGGLAILSLIMISLSFSSHKVFKHPIGILIVCYFLSQLLSFSFSTIYAVSAKSLLVSAAYILVFFFMTSMVVKEDVQNIVKLYMLYALSLFGVVAFTTFKHSEYGFDKNYSAVIVDPFFSDHTIYGVCIAFIIPVMAVFVFNRNVFKTDFFIKYAGVFMFLVFCFGVYLSHSRASWISIAAALLMYLLLKLKVSFRVLIGLFIIAIAVAFIFQEQLMPALVKNKYNSKAKRANLEEQIRSVTNVKNDVSNAERINRWLCAIRMFEARPVTGFGVGTYQFKYIPFQKGSEMTEISMTSVRPKIPMGKGGTAHSEYLLALSESGIFCFLSLILLIIFSVKTGMNVYYQAKEEKIKKLALMILLGIITYAVHGVFNNFLTTDKSAFLFLGSLSMLASLDVYYKNYSNEKN